MLCPIKSQASPIVAQFYPILPSGRRSVTLSLAIVKAGGLGRTRWFLPALLVLSAGELRRPLFQKRLYPLAVIGRAAGDALQFTLQIKLRIEAV